MRKKFLGYLLDPITSSPFDLVILEESGDHVVAGILLTETTWYPIIGGIPRVLVDELKKNMLQTRQEFFMRYKNHVPEHVRTEWQNAIDSIHDVDAFLKHQKITAESFAYEWKHIYKENNYEKNNFYHFAGPYVTENNIAGKSTLDIGCGSGRFTKWAALSGTTVSFGTDLGESVEVAFALTKDIENVCIVQADIYAMPFQNIFDLAYSIGVLHHLPQPKQGFLKLPKVLKKGGEMVIWVYNRRNNTRALYFYEPLRNIFKTLPKPLLFKLSYIPGLGVHLINLFGKFIEKIGFESLAAKLPFAYYANFPFNMKLNDAFDVIATPKSNYYYVEEIRRWYSEASLKDIQAFEHPEAGITCIATHE
ncbi:MAG: methyltransferase domain-containing protein [bacterium]|nr:methyltransferase domain-containing protein [bacterium]